MIRPALDILRERLKNALRRYNREVELFEITSDNVKAEFGISLEKFYYFVFPGRESDYGKCFDDYLKVFYSYTNMGNSVSRNKAALVCLKKIYEKIQKDKLSFATLSEIKAAFSDISWVEFEFNVRSTRCCKTIEEFLFRTGVLTPCEYYIKPTRDDLKKKNCLLDIVDEELCEIIKTILKQYGANIVTADADYIITDDVFVNDLNNKHSKIIKQGLENIKQSGKPMFVAAEMLEAMENIVLLENELKIAEVELTELSGKGCLIDDCFYDDYKSVIRGILTRYGVSIKRTFSKNVDYIVSCELCCSDISSYSDNMKLAAKEYAKKGRPLIIDGYDLISKEKKLVENAFLCMNKEEKLQYATKLYEICVSKIEAMMEKTKEYSIPLCSQDARISGKLYKTAKIEDAFEFFDVISVRNRCWDDTHNEIAETYKQMYRTIFVESEGYYCLPGRSLDGVAGCECPVALAVAAFVYASPENGIDVEFTRDKWEYRGDYRSSFFVAFELSNSYPEGRVYKSLQHRYSSM